MKPNRDLQEIIAHVLGRKRSEIFFEDLTLTQSQQDAINALWKRRESGEPLSYILEQVEFYGCQIEVNPSVLIPRLESELLVELVLKRLEGDSGLLLDLCTGSGALGLAIKKQRPDLTVILSDISPQATLLARKNAARNEIEVDILLGDLFAPLFERKIDFLVCNPPYVSAKEYEELEKSVREFEPKLALVGGDEGLDFYKRIEKESQNYFRDNGKLFFEIGASQGNSVKEIFSGAVWRRKEVLKDYANLDRFFFLEYQRSF